MNTTRMRVISRAPSRPRWTLLVPLLIGLLAVAAGAAEKKKGKEKLPYDLLQDAQRAYSNGDRGKAMDLVNKALKADPQNSEAYFARARIYEGDRKYDKAVSDYDQALSINPFNGEAYHARGTARFRLAYLTEAIEDFDKYLVLFPQQEAHHWQRGIAYYLAGDFEKGRRQFELHQTVNPNDVENSVWHFLCVARSSGIEKAREAYMPVASDSRTPMKQIQQLFLNQATVDAVLEGARSGNPSPAALRKHTFYAHLYLGLYYEAIGDDKQSRDYLSKAAAASKEFDYMGDVARVSFELKKKERAQK